MTAIADVRARLQRDLSLRLIHRDTAGDVQALLDHHADLLKAPAIDLEQFRVAVEAYEFEGECKQLEYCFGPDADKRAAEAQMADAKRLLALIDGQESPGCGACGDGCVARGSCRVRDESPPCKSEQPTKGDGERR